jgi:hypothetical protein
LDKAKYCWASRLCGEKPSAPSAMMACRAPVEVDKSSRSAAPEIYQQPDFPPAVPANRLELRLLTTPETINFYLFEGMGKDSQ